MGSQVHARHGHTGCSPAKGQEDDEGIGLSVLGGMAEKAGTV